MDESFPRQLRLEPKARLRPFLASRVAVHAASSSRLLALRIYWLVVGLLSIAIVASADWRAGAACALAVAAVAAVGWRRLFRYLIPFLR